jgi:L-aspartate oxidase
MPAIHPDAELAPRDVVARSVATLELAGRQAFLEVSQITGFADRFPGSAAIARAAGIDPALQPIPVTTAAHFHMGGIATDANGATRLRGLWACGEVAATGLHGGNRLASNSLLEGLVFGERIARAIRATVLPPPKGALEVPRRARLPARDAERIRALRQLIGASLGPVRDVMAMGAALEALRSWQPGSRAEEDMSWIARLMLRAALARRESRGAHFRTDCPDPSAGAAARSFVSPEPAPLEALLAARSRVA